MDVVTFGETMVLFVPDKTGALRFVNGFKKTIGGAESNVAIALARLGHQVGWMSKLGNDEFGLYIRNFIRGEGVDTSQVTFSDQLPTGVFFKERTTTQTDPAIYYYRKGSACSASVPGDVDKDYIKQAKYVHLTGITPALSDSAKDTVFHMLELAKKNKQTIVLDPNIRLKLWSAEEAKRVAVNIANSSDIVLPGLEEGELMTGEKEPEKIAQSLLTGRTKLVVVKLGEQGAYYATANEEAYVPGYRVEHVVDTVGAGDGFAAGVLSGLIRGWDYYSSVKLGNEIGSFALRVEGDVEGYPYRFQTEAYEDGSQILR